MDIEIFKDVISNSKTYREASNKLNLSVRSFKTKCKNLNLDISKLTSKVRFIPSCKKELEEYYIKNGAAATARYYNVSLAIIIGYLKKHNIEIIPYNGLIKNLPNQEEFLENYKRYSLNRMSMHYEVSTSVIRRWIKEFGLNDKVTKFTEWKNDRIEIENNLEYYINLNKKYDLLSISRKENISIEQLKKVFKENCIDIVLHNYNKSKGELEVREYISSFGIECISMKKLWNDIRYELDCFIPSINLAIEYCGEYWHSDLCKDKKYHMNKWKWCNEQNIKLITIFECEWKYKNSICKSMLQNLLKRNDKKIYARKCEFREISSYEAKLFHDSNHMMGGIYSSYNYGLYHNNILVCCLSFIKNRFKKDNILEISRFSSLLGYTIVGGFSKLLKRSNIKKCFTYVDNRFGDGNVYEKNGFLYIGMTIPNYFYYNKKIPSDGLKNRINYQKYKLSKLLNNYDSDLTEYENMMNHGYYRIWDCGNKKYIFERNEL